MTAVTMALARRFSAGLTWKFIHSLAVLFISGTAANCADYTATKAKSVVIPRSYEAAQLARVFEGPHNDLVAMFTYKRHGQSLVGFFTSSGSDLLNATDARKVATDFRAWKIVAARSRLTEIQSTYRATSADGKAFSISPMWNTTCRRPYGMRLDAGDKSFLVFVRLPHPKVSNYPPDCHQLASGRSVSLATRYEQGLIVFYRTSNGSVFLEIAGFAALVASSDSQMQRFFRHRDDVILVPLERVSPLLDASQYGDKLDASYVRKVEKIVDEAAQEQMGDK